MGGTGSFEDSLPLHLIKYVIEFRLAEQPVRREDSVDTYLLGVHVLFLLPHDLEH